MTNQEKSKILLVDDNPSNIRLAATILKSQDYSLGFARSGKDALEAIKKTQIDLILLDIVMPGMDGYETLREIKKIPSYQNTPVIFLTGQHDPDDIVKGYETGCVDYILKPFKSVELLMRVKQNMKIVDQEKKLLQKVAELEKTVRILDTKIKSAPTAHQKTTTEKKESTAEKKVPNQRVGINEYVLDDHRADLVEIEELLDYNVSIMVLNHDFRPKILQETASLIKQYSSILSAYSVFIKLGTGMYDLSCSLNNIEKDLSYEEQEQVMLYLESMTFTLLRWREYIFSENCENVNMFDDSLLADISTIEMTLSCDYENNEEIEFF